MSKDRSIMDSAIHEIENAFPGTRAIVSVWDPEQSPYVVSEIEVFELPEESFAEFEDCVYSLHRKLLDEHGIDCLFIHYYRKVAQDVVWIPIHYEFILNGSASTEKYFSIKHSQEAIDDCLKAA